MALHDPRRHAFFHAAFRRFFRRHMRALRLPSWGLPRPGPGEGPLVVFANHPSWWDGVAFMLLGRTLDGWRMFTPMEAAALARYRFMRRIGVFGVETRTTRGAAAFLRTARHVLAAPGRSLWINAPGRFQDPRERPVLIAPGLVRLPELAPAARFLPLALDYPFWTERKPEMLAAFGPPIPGAELVALDREARAERLRAALTETMDRLAAEAITHDPARFTVLVQGQEGMGGVYDLWRRLRAALRGRRFDARHEAR
ncbi:lysophospholipid acyltransferase family protein [Roseomonas sp. OT10]|uniref:lysophospholipid acyltransferase family protein n=1 Tax=Roseomonas cutis TaxID=2897332 RepID=UPI001E33847A|nr:lysophospholipid acyltransferase family protein [Roseomonas sp. OT10]UFN49930.1 lysophospholipid acyltransferase family protein [Roseomonas sp. OT10]